MIHRAAIAVAFVLLFAIPTSASPAKNDATMHLNENCTAFHVGDGFVVTAGHCIKAMGEQSLTLEDGTVIMGRLVIYSDTRGGGDDLAVIRISGADRFQALDVSCGPAPEVGDEVSVTGYPGHLGRTTVFGRVASTPAVLEHSPWGRPVIRVAIPIFGGLSGSAVINEDGQVVGVMVGALRDQMTLAWAIPSRRICALLDL